MDWIACLTPDAAADPLAALAAPPAGTTAVELRLDLFPHHDPAALVGACPLPVLATLRSRAEGGAGPDDAVERHRLIAAALEAGAALVDLEADRDLPLVDRLGLTPEEVVLSWHDPVGTPAGLDAVAARLLEHPARWVKVVPTAHSLDDVTRILELHERRNLGLRASRRRLIAFAMGPVGLPTRYLAPLLGPPLAYVAWSDAAPAAPGQVSRSRIDAAVGHLSGPPSRLFAVAGADVGASLSPALHGAGYRGAGLYDLMVPVNVPATTQLDRLFARRGRTAFDRAGLLLHGVAVTAPYKRAAAEAATAPAPRVARARSANTLVLRPDQILADTTDADGVVGSLRAKGVDPAGLRACVQGTGGAARAAAVGLHLAGAEVVLRGRDQDRTREIAAQIAVAALGPDDPADARILVNATPLGGSVDDPLPFAPEELARATAVVDMVYGDAPTILERAAAEAGIAVAGGREMLLHQGLAQFAAFAGRVPPKEAMRAALGLD